MPELPEVETVRRGIEPVMSGATIAVAEARITALRRPVRQDFAQCLVGSRVEAVRRRAKYILVDTHRGLSLLLHLGMSGRLTRHQGPGAPPLVKHDHVRWRFDRDGKSGWVVFNDARRFGVCELVDRASLSAHPLLQKLGPEPLGDTFTPAYLGDRLRGKASSIKAALLDQSVVAGLGNIYAAEALWRARISPRRAAGTLVGARAGRLVAAIRAVLTEAIASGGSTLRDYVRSDGNLGYFQHHFDVYDRAGQPCRREDCIGTVKRLVQSGRSTCYCPRCQR